MVFACERFRARVCVLEWSGGGTIFRASQILPELLWARGPGVFAQVGEWLKPTDCKSVPPSEVRRFESFPVHQDWFADARDRVKRLVIALAAFVALGVLSWATISDQRIRLGTLAILAMFALKTWVRRKDVLHPDEKDVET